MKFKDLNMNQRKVLGCIIEEGNFILGGYENAVEDGTISCMPEREKLLDEIYYDVLTVSVKEVRFVGTIFIKENIDKYLIKEGY